MGLLEHTYRSKLFRMPSADGDILSFIFRKALWANQTAYRLCCRDRVSGHLCVNIRDVIYGQGFPLSMDVSGQVVVPGDMGT